MRSLSLMMLSFTNRLFLQLSSSTSISWTVLYPLTLTGPLLWCTHLQLLLKSFQRVQVLGRGHVLIILSFSLFSLLTRYDFVSFWFLVILEFICWRICVYNACFELFKVDSWLEQWEFYGFWMINCVIVLYFFY